MAKRFCPHCGKSLNRPPANLRGKQHIFSRTDGTMGTASVVANIQTRQGLADWVRWLFGLQGCDIELRVKRENETCKIVEFWLAKPKRVSRAEALAARARWKREDAIQKTGAGAAQPWGDGGHG